MPFPHFRQLDKMDYSLTCLRMIAKYYGANYSLQSLRERTYISKAGVSMEGIIDAAEAIGFRTLGIRVTVKQLIEEIPILYWNKKQ